VKIYDEIENLKVRKNLKDRLKAMSYSVSHIGIHYLLFVASTM
jgi:hypothetical protein